MKVAHRTGASAHKKGAQPLIPAMPRIPGALICYATVRITPLRALLSMEPGLPRGASISGRLLSIERRVF